MCANAITKMVALPRALSGSQRVSGNDPLTVVALFPARRTTKSYIYLQYRSKIIAKWLPCDKRTNTNSDLDVVHRNLQTLELFEVLLLSNVDPLSSTRLLFSNGVRNSKFHYVTDVQLNNTVSANDKLTASETKFSSKIDSL